MGVTLNHLAAVATGRKRWTPRLRVRALAVLGEVPGQGMVYRLGGVARGEQLHPEACPGAGHEHAGSGQAGGGRPLLLDTGVPWP